MKIGMTPERRVQLEIDGGYDKHGDVFVIARPLAGSVSFPVKTFGDAKALEQFIEKFTFFRYVGQCPSWGSVLFANDCFSGEEKYSDTLKGKSYTSEEGKAYVIQLIASGELVVHETGSWIPPDDRNHHLPWPKSSAKEEFLPVKHQPYTLGPHEEPGYVPPVETSTVLDEKDEKVVPDNIRIRGAAENPRFAPYNLNENGVVRTQQEAIDLARSHGVEIGDDITVGFMKNWSRRDADAEYFTRQNSFKPDDWIEWDDFLHETTGKVPVRFNSKILNSDESIVAHISHEMHELNSLRNIFAERGAIQARELNQLIATRKDGGLSGNLHEKAWDIANQLVFNMRGGQ